MRSFKLCTIIFAIAMSSPLWLFAKAEKNITRQCDPVIVKGSDAGAMSGKTIEGIRVYAYVDGGFRPVPFQVDEKTTAGDYVFPNGVEKNPADGDGLFYGNDELVLMAKDLGDEAGDLTGAVTGFDGAAEVVVTDPMDNARGFAYMLHFPANPPARSPEDYVTIDPAANRIIAETYELGFTKEAPMAMGELRVTKAGGGDGVDYCDRLKARLHCQIAGVSVDKNEEDFNERIVAWIDGPVRVVRRTRSSLKLFWDIPSPSAKLDNIYYYNSFSFPTEVFLPVDLGFIVRDASFRVSVDSPKLSGQRRYRNSLYPEGVIQDGRMSEKEKKLAADPRPFAWSSTGTVGADGKDHGAWFNRLIVESDNPDWKPRVFYIDDENNLDPPDLEPGSYGNAGYQIDKLNDVTAGVYRLESVMYSVPVWEPSMADDYMRVLDHPVEVSVSDLQ